MFVLFSSTSSGRADCRDELVNLFTIQDARIQLGENCHPPTAGCTGCATEIIEPKNIVISLSSNLITYFYHVERPNVRGECPVAVKWNRKDDPYDAKIEVEFKISNGVIRIKSTKEIRNNPQDTRPSWAAQKMISLIRQKDGTRIDCPDSN